MFCLLLLVMGYWRCVTERGASEMARRPQKSVSRSFFLKLKLGLVHRTSSKIHELGKTIKRWLKLKTITDHKSVTYMIIVHTKVPFHLVGSVVFKLEQVMVPLAMGRGTRTITHHEMWGTGGRILATQLQECMPGGGGLHPGWTRLKWF